MATMTAHMGYVGSVTIDGVSFFMTGSSLNPTQAVEAPDAVAGSVIRRGWVYGKVDPTGNVTGPLHENATSLWTKAFNRTDDLDHLEDTVAIEIFFYRGGGWSFPECVINSLQISATAGEVITFTADFAGRSQTNATVGNATEMEPCAKLMTWDRCVFGISDAAGKLDNLQSINLTLNNNVQKLFAIQGEVNETDGLYPVDLPCGVREITGSISAYAQVPIHDLLAIGIGADHWAAYDYDSSAKTVTFAVVGDGGNIIDVDFKAVFSRPEGSGQTGPAIYTLNFTAVCEPNDATL
jgi:hypothetical protein